MTFQSAIAKHGLTLAVALALSAGLVVAADAVWRETIEDNRRRHEKKLLLETLSEVAHKKIVAVPKEQWPSPPPSVATIERLWRAENGDKLAATAVQVAVRGYGGDIIFIAAFAPDGRRLQSRIVRHAETPGIADFLSLPDGGEKAIDGVSGATITSAALSQAAAALAPLLRDPNY